MSWLFSLRGGVCVHLWRAGLLAMLLHTPTALAQASTPVAAQPAVRSADAERLFEEARPRLIQIRTLTRAGGAQSSIGSGFRVGPDLAVTNFHVIADWVHDNKLNTLEWVSMDERRGEAVVLAVDVTHDLAVVRLTGEPGTSAPYTLATREPARGERVFSLGRPLDIGFNIIEGTHNGLVEGDINQHFHFSGAINAGMSGGPALTRDGQVFGVNVAVNLSGQLISYLVPIRFAQTLLARVPTTPPTAEALRKELSTQFAARQASLMQRLFGKPLPTRELGRFRVSSELPGLLKCWSNTSSATQNNPVRSDALQCQANAALFLDDSLTLGSVSINHRLLRGEDMSRLRFASLTAQSGDMPSGFRSTKHFGLARCTDEFVRLGNGSWHVKMCLRALRELDALYELHLTAISMHGREADAQGHRQALLSSLHIEGAAHADLMFAAKRFLESLQ